MEAMFKRILVPLDGSERAEQALSVAARMARGSGGSVILLQVVDVTVSSYGYVAPPLIGGHMGQGLKKAGFYWMDVRTSEWSIAVQRELNFPFGFVTSQILSVAASSQLD